MGFPVMEPPERRKVFEKPSDRIPQLNQRTKVAEEIKAKGRLTSYHCLAFYPNS